MSKPMSTDEELDRILLDNGCMIIAAHVGNEHLVPIAKAAIQAHYAAKMQSVQIVPIVTPKLSAKATKRLWDKMRKEPPLNVQAAFIPIPNHQPAIDVLEAELQRLTASWEAGEMSREEFDGQAAGLRAAAGLLYEANFFGAGGEGKETKTYE